MINARHERAKIALAEAKEANRVMSEQCKQRVETVKRVLMDEMVDIKQRFETTFAYLNDLILQ